MKKLPIGIQNFREIIEGNYVYADKTEHIYSLIYDAKYYFLSRPRRFGKSLLLDTIAEVFGGNKELFKGLWIYDSDYTFTKHPVISIDMSRLSAKSPDVLEEDILQTLRAIINNEELSIDNGSPQFMFIRLIEELHKKHSERVVVLIDEYDKPILDNITDIRIAEENRKVLRGFYGILKSMDPHLEFTLLTGVTKFTKTSVFSELNNLSDITMDEQYANICGITIDDFDDCFAEHIKNSSSVKGLKHFDNIRDEILRWYDGYSWDGETKVLNPFSLLNFFSRKRFAGFWYASGTPKFLIDLIREKPEAYTNTNKLKITEFMLDSSDLENIAIEPLLFQSGYLTVKEIEYEGVEPVYCLDIPNLEVKMALNLHIVSTLTGSGDIATRGLCGEISDAFDTGNMQNVLSALQRLFSSIPNQIHVNQEAYYHSVIYAVLSFAGLNIASEVSVARGRIDAVLEYSDKIYVIEFKYRDCDIEASAERKQDICSKALDEGMKQIDEQEYCKPYLGGGKAIYKAAFVFLGRGDIEMRYELLE